MSLAQAFNKPYKNTAFFLKVDGQQPAHHTENSAITIFVAGGKHFQDTVQKMLAPDRGNNKFHDKWSITACRMGPSCAKPNCTGHHMSEMPRHIWLRFIEAHLEQPNAPFGGAWRSWYSMASAAAEGPSDKEWVITGVIITPPTGGNAPVHMSMPIKGALPAVVVAVAVPAAVVPAAVVPAAVVPAAAVPTWSDRMRNLIREVGDVILADNTPEAGLQELKDIQLRLQNILRPPPIPQPDSQMAWAGSSSYQPNGSFNMLPNFTASGPYMLPNFTASGPYMLPNFTASGPYMYPPQCACSDIHCCRDHCKCSNRPKRCDGRCRHQ